MDTDAIQAAEEVLAKKHRQMAQLREQRVKLNERIAKQKVPKYPLTSPLSSTQLYSGPNAIKLSGIELEAVTRLNTLCNGQQLAKLITKPTADMIAHVQELHQAERVTWSEQLSTVIASVGAEAMHETLYQPPILKQREAGFQFPYNNEPLQPVVMRRAPRQIKIKTLADLDPTKV